MPGPRQQGIDHLGRPVGDPRRGIRERGAAGPDELALFYGGQPPGGEVSRTRRVVLHVVPDDEFFTADEFAAVEDGFRAAGTELTTYRYGGSRHWFAERGSPAFDEAAFELARSRVLEQLGR